MAENNARGGDRAGGPGGARRGSGSGASRGSGGTGRAAGPRRDGGRSRDEQFHGAGARRDAGSSAGRGERDALAPRHDDPSIPDDVLPSDLDRGARVQLKTLTKENAEFVARHLVMASRLIEEDPPLAHQHALAAARRGGRIAVVRESVGITAYTVGDFALALRELRTFRRISGSDEQLPLMVDSERGLGRPDRALELARSVPSATLTAGTRVSLAIAKSGARLDQGNAEAALAELQIPELDPDVAFSYSPALFDAYATVLEELGRADEAAEWFERSERASAALGLDDDDGDDDEIEVVEEPLDEAASPPSEHDQ